MNEFYSEVVKINLELGRKRKFRRICSDKRYGYGTPYTSGALDEIDVDHNGSFDDFVEYCLNELCDDFHFELKNPNTLFIFDRQNFDFVKVTRKNFRSALFSEIYTTEDSLYIKSIPEVKSLIPALDFCRYMLDINKTLDCGGQMTTSARAQIFSKIFAKTIDNTFHM